MAFGESSAQFTMPEFNVPNTNISSGANVIDLGSIAGIVEANSYDPAEIAKTNILNRARERAEVIGQTAQTYADGAAILGDVRGNKYRSEGAIEGAKGAADGATKGAATQALMTGITLLAMSDESTKDNIKAIDDALETLRKLRPVTFNYKEEWSMTPERTHHGFIAQEYKEAMPDATYYDEEYEKYCIDSVDLIGLLVRAIQQLETRVARMEAEKALVGAN